MRSAITLCLVPEAKAGPFVFHGDLSHGIRRASELGFDAVEIFAPAGDAVNAAELGRMLNDHGMKLAAVGTGAGFLLRKLSLTDPDATARARAIDFIKRIIDLGGPLGAPAIIGSMQGRHADGDRDSALARLADSLDQLSRHAQSYALPILFEPLNRYETNIFNRQSEAAAFLRSHGLSNVKILADHFHMNIEESNLAATLRDLSDQLGHVHFVDSNRRAPGLGHIDYPPIIAALRAIDFRGYLSAEALPFPDSITAAQQTIQAFKQLTTDH
jgi:sugar phosphate isomerase/epimerase